MKKFDWNIAVLGLHDTYHECGEYSFKIILNPKRFKNSHEVQVVVEDPDGVEMPILLKKWGRKMTCTFSVNAEVSDGVCVVHLSIPKDNKVIDEILHFWVIK